MSAPPRKAREMDPVEPIDRLRRYLEPQGRLKPANAAVALVVDEAGRYLVQLRDAKRSSFPIIGVVLAGQSSQAKPVSAASPASWMKNLGWI